MEISRQDFEAYEDVRQSGVVNMFDIRKVGELTGLEKPVIRQIMTEYTELKKLFGTKDNV